MKTTQQGLVLLVSILASLVAFLDSSVTNVALPAIARELHGGLPLQQWVVDAYLITLGSLILLAGSLADTFGQKRVLRIGLWGFGITSLLCAAAPGGVVLIIARILQGVAGAILVPSSLSLIIGAFEGEAQGKAIGTWTAWTGIAFIIGPLLGGFLVDSVSWRAIFAINVLPIVVTLWLLARISGSEMRTPGRIDFPGAALCSLGLAGIVFALIEQPSHGWGSAMIAFPLILGALALVAFVLVERRSPKPIVPLSLFAVRNFLFGNLATLAIYGGLSVSLFLVTVFIQQVGGYSSLHAGLALVPVTLVMFFLSSRFGALAGRYGPRAFMTIGPLLVALGFLSMLRVNASVSYWSQIFPGVMLLGLGLSVTVAPLTSAVLGSIAKTQAGIGSAINNAVSRIAGLVAVALIGVLIGTQLDLASFRKGVIFMTALLVLGGAISFVGIRNPVRAETTPAAPVEPTPAV